MNFVEEDGQSLLQKQQQLNFKDMKTGHCCLYRIENGVEFLGYTKNSEVFNFPDAYPISLVLEDVDPIMYSDLQLIALDEWEHNKRTRDKRLEEEGIKSFDDLYKSNILLKRGYLKKSAYIRQAILDKYADVLEYCNTTVVDEQ